MLVVVVPLILHVPKIDYQRLRLGNVEGADAYGRPQQRSAGPVATPHDGQRQWCQNKEFGSQKTPSIPDEREGV